MRTAILNWPLFSLVPALAAADAAPPKAQSRFSCPSSPNLAPELPLTYPVAPKAAPTKRGQPLKSKLANAWGKVKELGRKVKEKVKKEKEAVLRKHGEYRELLGEEDDDDDDDDEEEGEMF
ncbi:MAG: hypothetical protein LQ349_009464 [Xanthoria aureola]|nr:MAG: hypothetical protein LQ349_009464 [Xanthoria aureola]